MPELRRDPADGQDYSLQEIWSYYSAMGCRPAQIKDYWAAMKPPPPKRFGQGDRVLGCVGQRWLVGTVLSVDVDDPEDENEHPLAYVIKVDGVPGSIEATTISAPADTDGVVRRERCFSVKTEVVMTRWAAPLTDKRQALRFELGARVAIRVQDSAGNYEHWLEGAVTELWPALPPSGPGILKSAEAVPYKVKTDKGEEFYCHRDDHTLIRLPENIPREPIQGVSKRFENRVLADGRIERFDHMTLRGRITAANNDDMSD